jgi:hypothetical protein
VLWLSASEKSNLSSPKPYNHQQPPVELSYSLFLFLHTPVHHYSPIHIHHNHELLSFGLLSHIALSLELSETSEMRHYATILHSFQFAIERYTFSFIALKSCGLALFSTIYSLPHRRAALDNISYDVIIPSYSLNCITKFENASEKEVNNAPYAVQGLFEILHFWGKQQGRNITGVESILPNGSGV